MAEMYGGITPEMLNTVSRGTAAQSSLNGLANNPETIKALRDANTPYGQVQGQGFSSSAPGGLQVLGEIVNRNAGNQGIKKMQTQADALRGQIAKGSEQELMMKLEMKREEERLKREGVTNQRAYDAEVAKKAAAEKERVRLEEAGQVTTAPTEYTDGQGNKRMLSRRKDGKWVDENRNVVDSIEGWTESPKATITSDGSAYKSEGANKRAEETINALGAADRVVALYKKIPPATKEKMGSNLRLLKDTAQRIPGADIAQLIRNTRDISQEEKQYMAALAKMSAKERHAMFGGALTQYEGMSGLDFLSYVYNMRPEDQMLRVQNSVADNINKLRTGDSLYGGEKGSQYMDAFNRMGYENLNFDSPNGSQSLMDQLNAIDEEG